MNLLIILGAFFTLFTSVGAASGYLLILTGLIKHRPLKEVKAARILLLTLTLLELLQDFSSLPPFLTVLLGNVLAVLPVYLFYLILKGEYMWNPRRQVFVFLKRYTVIGILYVLAVAIQGITDSLLIMRLAISSTFYTYLFYVFMTLYVRNPNRKRLALPKLAARKKPSK
ncbi:MAG: hypothetical protein FWF59_05565 [Turicibacter sp.]|nr:hypothetical protein [Turicibacter sp.]